MGHVRSSSVWHTMGTDRACSILGGFVFPMTWPFETFQKKGYLEIFQKYNIVGPVLIV